MLLSGGGRFQFGQRGKKRKGKKEERNREGRREKEEMKREGEKNGVLGFSGFNSRIYSVFDFSKKLSFSIDLRQRINNLKNLLKKFISKIKNLPIYEIF